MNGRTHRGTGQRYGQNRQESFARFAAAQLSCNSSAESRIMVAEEKNTRFERRMKLAYIDEMRRGELRLSAEQEG